MVSTVDSSENLFLVNAPAGSGKTTFIKDKINKITNEDNKSNILCITYTNRAVEELLSKIDSKNVEIKTIHSFISEFISIYFSNKEIVELFFDLYKDEIESRIANVEQDEKREESNKKYREEHDNNLSFEFLKQNTQKINYNELSFNSYYYGGLSHDELLVFAELIMDQYPIIKKRLSSKFQYIFIDEYQDTSANILRFFYKAIERTSTKLFLFGDRMQQIYKNYDGSFEDTLKKFNTTEYQLTNNYRSVKNIVDILNKIYNCSDFKQIPQVENIEETPTIYITNDSEKTILEIEETYPNILKLFIANRARFEKIGACDLFNAVGSLDKYSFARKYSAVDVLLTNSNDNPDPLFKILFNLNDFFTKYKANQYGLVIQKIKDKHNRLYNKDILKINVNGDKITFKSSIDNILNIYSSNITVGKFLQDSRENNFLTSDSIEGFFENYDENEYKIVLEQNLEEFRKLCAYLEQPRVSTQHGVKGEGHDAVLFLAEDSGNPPVKMYKFFELFSKYEINYKDFEEFYYDYLIKVAEFESKNNILIKDLKKASFEPITDVINKFVAELMEVFAENLYFNFFFAEAISLYQSKPNVTNLSKAIKPTDVYGTLTAYKLFYVGCSRAKHILKIIVDVDKIASYREAFETKMKSTGFHIK